MTDEVDDVDESDDEEFEDVEDDDTDELEPTTVQVAAVSGVVAVSDPGDEEESLNDILTRVARPGWKPDISHLKDAVIDGCFMVPVGGRLLIQFPDEWRDTAVFKVLAIDPECVTGIRGNVRLWDHNKMQYAGTNYITAAGHGCILKVPDEKRRWAPGEGDDMRTRRKRRRRRALVKDEKPVAPVVLDANGNPVKKKRGRPKGSKNKSTLEKEAKEKSDG